MDEIDFSLFLTYQDDFGYWPGLKPEFEKYTPLKSLVWKGLNGQQTRFVPELDIQFISFAESGKRELNPLGWQSRPFVNIFFVGNSADNDSYKSIVKPRIQTWINQVASLKNQEWLVVYVTTEDEHIKNNSKFINIRGTNLERIRTDFQAKKDISRVSLLKIDNNESWLELIAKLKDLIIITFENQARGFQTDARRMNSMRNMSGWNYCSFFIIKEGLAHLYICLGEYEEALKQYDELEATFHETLTTWFKGVGSNIETSDYIDLLQLPSKLYRQQILENKISVFDFREYLFSCQARLLVKMENIKEFMNRAQKYIKSLVQTLKDLDKSISDEFISAWTYSTCQNVVEICEGSTHQAIHDSAQTRSVAASKAHFLFESRRQLEFLGSLYNRLPENYSSMHMELEWKTYYDKPNSDRTDKDSENDNEEKETTPDAKTKNLILLEALKSDSRFDQIFSNISEQAYEYFEEAGKHRFANMLKRDVAHLHMCRKRYQKARIYLEQLLPQDGDDQGWIPFHTKLLVDLAECQQNLELWSAYLLTIQKLLTKKSDLTEEMISLCFDQLIKISAEKLTVGYELNMNPAFQIKSVYVDEKSGNIIALVESMIENEVMVDAFNLVLSCSNSNLKIKASSNKCSGKNNAENTIILKKGENMIKVGCKTVSAPGIYYISKSELIVGKSNFCSYFDEEKDIFCVKLVRNDTLPNFSILPFNIQNANSKEIRIQIFVRSNEYSIYDANIQIFDEEQNQVLTNKTKVKSCTLSTGLNHDNLVTIDENFLNISSLEKNTEMNIVIEGIEKEFLQGPVLLETYLGWSGKDEKEEFDGLSIEKTLVELDPAVKVTLGTSVLPDSVLAEVYITNSTRFPIRLTDVFSLESEIYTTEILVSNIVGLVLQHGQSYTTFVQVSEKKGTSSGEKPKNRLLNMGRAVETGW
ncbi:hypothetical protein BB559_003579 [Furculomyces boomerangus]|uniref:TRAPPC10/Trs130 N-terminal domain-containing protein n=1 Tax=Furculomyces boomerangus TaxID=61424 RepID=A0A2T9YKF1_9FUNG|nr:hypothetical protein BB559_003579 [Furculomyces boomerangus]